MSLFQAQFLAVRTELDVALHHWIITKQKEKLVTLLHVHGFHGSVVFYVISGRLDKALKDYWSCFEIFNIIFLVVCSDSQLFPILPPTQELPSFSNCIQCICCLSWCQLGCQEGWNEMIFKVSFNPSHFVNLCPSKFVRPSQSGGY